MANQIQISLIFKELLVASAPRGFDQHFSARNPSAKGSYSPPPMWQALLSVLVGLLSAIVSVWFAAKIFRIGLLMHGRPPNLATLIRWARNA